MWLLWKILFSIRKSEAAHQETAWRTRKNPNVILLENITLSTTIWHFKNLPIQQHVSHSFSRNNSVIIYQFSSPGPNKNTLVHKILLIVKYHSFRCHSRDYKQMCCFDEYGIIWFELSAISIQDIQVIFRIQILKRKEIIILIILYF